MAPKNGKRDELQTFVFSATLSKDLQRNLKRKFRPGSKKKHHKHDIKPASTLGNSGVLVVFHLYLTPSLVDDLLLRLDFRDPKPEVIDLSPVGGVVSTLQEAKIECLSADKVFFLPIFPKLWHKRIWVFFRMFTYIISCFGTLEGL